MDRIPRRLTAIETRVLGSLLEKEQTTPESYPMTLNALVAACNQKNNREPVLELVEAEVEAALRALFEDVLVWRSEGARALKWSHNVDRRWRLTPATKALVTVLLLRGAQTPGELRARTERMHPFASVGAVEAALGELAAGEEPLAVELPCAPGQKENRWRLRVTEGEVEPPPEKATGRFTAPAGDFESRLAELEERVRRLEAAHAAPGAGDA